MSWILIFAPHISVVFLSSVFSFSIARFLKTFLLSKIKDHAIFVAKITCQFMYFRNASLSSVSWPLRLRPSLMPKKLTSVNQLYKKIEFIVVLLSQFHLFFSNRMHRAKTVWLKSKIYRVEQFQTPLSYRMKPDVF